MAHLRAALRRQDAKVPSPARVEEYFAGLNRKRMAAGMLFRDAAGRVPLVEPSYKPNWEIPGGAVSADESPRAAARPELTEESGWDRPVGRLLVVDYVSQQDSRPEGVVFVFGGGVLDEDAMAGLVFADGEVVSAAFCDPVEVRQRTKPLLADRLAVAVDAAGRGETVPCEHGHRVT